MSYVDEILEKVIAKNPAQPEFHQAVKEVLESLRVVIEANEEHFRKEALLEREIYAELVTGNILMCMTGIGNPRL